MIILENKLKRPNESRKQNLRKRETLAYKSKIITIRVTMKTYQDSRFVA